jgi:hypothetical protein
MSLDEKRLGFTVAEEDASSYGESWEQDHRITPTFNSWESIWQSVNAISGRLISSHQCHPVLAVFPHA